MNSLIIGMGIGQLYKDVLKNAGHSVITVDQDINKRADYTSVEDAIKHYRFFDTIHICTPNFTHLSIARKVAMNARLIFIEKPGVQTHNEWCQLIEDYPGTRFMMVKNNQFRENISDLIDTALESHTIKLKWENKNRVPNAGSWFTNSDLAFGGVSRDLLPHLLSLVCKFNTDYSNLEIVTQTCKKNWILNDLVDTEYGSVNQNGIYNVDDQAEIHLKDDHTSFILSANWKTDETDDRSITFETKSYTYTFELGLCPEDAYINMIETAFRNLNNQEFWNQNYKQDAWIHKIMESFKI